MPSKIINYIDPVLSLCLVTIILLATFPVIKESAFILLQAVPRKINVSNLKSDLQKYVPEILNVYDLHIWKLSGPDIIATCHIIFENTSDYVDNADRITNFFKQRGIYKITVQPEFTDHNTGNNQDSNLKLEC